MYRRRKISVAALLLTLSLMLGGCVTTVDQLYCLPRRSEEYHNLQSVMDPVMEGLAYAAPASGQNQQSVQMADLDGDGTEEAILFTRGGEEDPLKIFVFRRERESFSLMDTIEASGTGFDQVEYAQMDGQPGLELVVGRQVSDQVLGNVTVYQFNDGRAVQMMSADYREYLICDLDQDELGDLLILTGVGAELENAVAERYTMAGGVIQRSAEARLSRPVDQLKRIMTGKLHGGQNAVFVASTVDANTIITDVFALSEGNLTNVSLSSEAGTSVKTLRNYYVYADDIDQDGILELPCLITMRSAQERSAAGDHLIRWYAMTPDGGEVDKLYTYHHYQQGWYLELAPESAERICVTPAGAGGYRFGLWKEDGSELTELWTIYMLTGEDRSAVAVEENRFVLLKTDSVVWACSMETRAMELGVTQEKMIGAFHLIQSDWYTGEM